MAILTRDTPVIAPKPSFVKKPDQVTLSGPVYRGATVDTRFIDQSALLTHISGSSWVATYFQQQLAGEDAPSFYQPDRDATYQQYLKILNFEFKVSSTLGYSQNADTKGSELTGSALVYPPLIPNAGDIFIADIGDGQEGLFSITNAGRLSVLTKTAYEVSYTLIGYVSEAYLQDLQKKTIKTVRFVKELIQHGESPFLLDQSYNLLLESEQEEKRLLNHYIRQFYNKSSQTLLVPGQRAPTYDGFLINALKSVYNTHNDRRLKHIKAYTVAMPGHTAYQTLWDAFIALDKAILPLCHEKLAIVPVRLFDVFPQYEDIRFSQIDEAIYPIDRNHSVDAFSSLLSAGAQPHDIRHDFKTSFLGNLDLLGKKTTGEVAVLKPIHPVTIDDYYVFSEAFYFETAGQMSQLEHLVHQALDFQRFDLDQVFTLCRESLSWGALEQFYYIPFLLFLLRLARLETANLKQ